MQPDKSDLSVHTPKAKARIITIKVNLIRSLLINLRTKRKNIPKITNTTTLKFWIISGEIQSGSEFTLAISGMILDTYED
tara:strand:- start:175 stop:414 length:240 start_codon:yes stop_codon:yes gene_type:complete